MNRFTLKISYINNCHVRFPTSSGLDFYLKLSKTAISCIVFIIKYLFVKKRKLLTLSLFLQEKKKPDIFGLF